MEIRDPIHGSIEIMDDEIPIIEHPNFQRLRNIKQLGFSEYIFPGATHTRYLHSIGVMHNATKIFDSIWKNRSVNADIIRLRSTLRLAALLHDVGHAPLSHSTELVMPPKSRLKLPFPFDQFQNDLQADHEDYTIKTIVDSTLTDSFKAISTNKGVSPICVAELIAGRTFNPHYFIIDGINYFPFFHQIVSSEMDADRMDYLLRDSYFCGVSYGSYDLAWIIDNLHAVTHDNHAYLALSERAISTFDDFLLSRFHMFLMVYFHYRAVCLEQMIYRYFKECPNDYTIPDNIDEYRYHDDHHLLRIMRDSDNRWAKRIISNNIPRKLYEVFGNDPNQNKILIELKQALDSENIEYIHSESNGRLSKYYNDRTFNKQNFPLKVLCQYPKNKPRPRVINLHDATSLYSKYSQTHAVKRIHCDYDKLSHGQQKLIENIMNQ